MVYFQWLSLTGFVKFLGRTGIVRFDVDADCVMMLYTLCTGICEVEPTPKGWFIKYIDRDPETIKRQAVG